MKRYTGNVMNNLMDFDVAAVLAFHLVFRIFSYFHNCSRDYMV